MYGVTVVVWDDCDLDVTSLGQVWIHACLNHLLAVKERNPGAMLKSEQAKFCFSLNFLRDCVVSPKLRVRSYTCCCRTKNLAFSICYVIFTMESLYCFAEQQITGMKQQQTLWKILFKVSVYLTIESVCWLEIFRFSDSLKSSPEIIVLYLESMNFFFLGGRVELINLKTL